jgi:hypothetical protein
MALSQHEMTSSLTGPFIYSDENPEVASLAEKMLLLSVVREVLHLQDE